VTDTAHTDLAFAGPGALAAMVRSGETSPREMVELYLRRIEALDPKLNAFRVVRAEQALAEAESADRSGPLAGVPIAVKDDIDLAGEAATRGSRSFGAPAAADAEPIRRLRAAGAIPIGVTNVPELMIFPWTATAANGVTRNPWDPARTTGGSSGGSGAAVAAGLVAAATASDGGGSIRIPAAACGLVGMKPTRGRVPSGGGWLGLSTYGALARTVSDSALLLDVMHGPAPDDPHHAPAFTGSYVEAAATPPNRLKIAVSRKLPPGRTGALLSALGHDVVPRDPAYRMAQIEFVQTWMRGIYEESLQIPDRTVMEASTRQMAAMGRYLVPSRRREAILAARARTTARITALWDRFDVLLLPTLAKTAIAAEGGYGKPAPMAIDIAGRFAPFTPIFNVTGQPAISIPAGVGTDGLPLAVQLVGRVGAEDTLYSLAGQIEAAAPWAQRRPVVS
jgi:amidase